MATKNGTEGRVYGGDCNLIHVADGNRANMGAWLANELDTAMRQAARYSGARTYEQAISQLLCPGCYMIVLFNASVTLAKNNGQSLNELADSMIAAYQRLKECDDKDACIEEIAVILDKEEQTPQEQEFSPLGGVKDYHINLRD